MKIEEVIEEMTEGMTEEVIGEMTEEMTEEVIGEMTEGMREEVTEEMRGEMKEDQEEEQPGMKMKAKLDKKMSLGVVLRAVGVSAIVTGAPEERGGRPFASSSMFPFNVTSQ